MKDMLDGKIFGALTFRHVLLLISALAMVFSTFLTWFTYNNFGNPENLTGINICQRYAGLTEILALPLIGATLFIGTLVIAQLAEFASTSRYPKYVAMLLSILALIISVETALRLQPLIEDRIGMSFLNNAGCGWYLAVGGAIFSLVAVAIPRRKGQ